MQVVANNEGWPIKMEVCHNIAQHEHNLTTQQQQKHQPLLLHPTRECYFFGWLMGRKEEFKLLHKMILMIARMLVELNLLMFLS